MYLGTALTLIAVGAILTFAVTGEPFSFVSLDAVGIILMLVGLVGAILELAIWRPRRTTAVGTTRQVVRERDVL
jgi:hypothetical protein